MKYFTRLRGDLQEHGTISFVSMLPINPEVMNTHPRIPITAMSPKSEARQNIVTWRNKSLPPDSDQNRRMYGKRPKAMEKKTHEIRKTTSHTELALPK